MEFSNITTLIGIVQEIDRICGSNDTSYPVKDKAARVNAALDRFCFLAITSDGNWQFDDFNKSDLPIGTQNLVSAQYDYEFADEVLMVEKVMVKDSSGNWHELEPININDDDAKNLWKRASNNTGTPTRYDKFAHSILLDPTPNYASTGGLKVVFKRNVVKFVSTDTDTECGIPDIFHPYICYLAALPYLIEKGLASKNDIMALIQRDEIAIKKFFAIRSQDTRNIIKPRITPFR